MAEGSSTSTPVRIIALGGLGEIGLNLMLIEYGERALIIDAGVMFAAQRGTGEVAPVLPDLTYLRRSRLALEAVLLTHGHEDHIGALPELLRQFQAPVYGGPVTLALARRRLDEAGVAKAADLRPMAPRRRFELGPFGVEPIHVTHSTPDSLALAITTPAGVIVHTGDFKIDRAPIDGVQFDRERFAELGAQGVALLLSDSTNAEVQGRSGSESSLRPILRDLLSRARGRVFLSTFSSHMHRLAQVTQVSREMGRRVAPLGRRMAESVRLGLELGQLNFPAGTFVHPYAAEVADQRKLTFVVSGSQGEPLSALSRLAHGVHPRAIVEPGDMVALSVRTIPGNEKAVNSLINDFFRLGAEVFYDPVAPVHVSGHAARDELAEMIALTQPKYFVPIHGEYRHLSHHVKLAMESGISESNCFLLEDGEVLLLERNRAYRAGRVTVGRMASGRAGADEAIAALRDPSAGPALIGVVAVSRATGEVVGGPDLIARGVSNGISKDLPGARNLLYQRLRELPDEVRGNQQTLKNEVVRTLLEYFDGSLDGRVLVLPHVMEV